MDTLSHAEAPIIDAMCDRLWDLILGGRRQTFG